MPKVDNWATGIRRRFEEIIDMQLRGLAMEWEEGVQKERGMLHF